MPDRLFATGSGSASEDRSIVRRSERGELRKLHQGLYTDNLTDRIDEVARRNALQIASILIEKPILSGRSALSMRPTMGTDEAGEPVGYLFLIDPDRKSRGGFSLPGLQIMVFPGAGEVDGDYPAFEVLAVSKARALLDNLQPSRARGTAPTRTIGTAGVETELDRLCRIEGEEHLNRIRDQARTIAPALGLEPEFTQLDATIGALLRTRNVKLSTPAGRARAAGEPIDEACLNRIALLRGHLEDVALPDVVVRSELHGSRIAASFIEAYFSNFIEGTRFAVGQAQRIVFDGEIPEQRPADGHDVLSTYRQLVEIGVRAPSALNADDFMEELQKRHFLLMEARPDVGPGQWKRQSNAAGATTFVAPEAVQGTLRQGLSTVKTIKHPFARAVLLHFLLADVHPFSDGNGRISRIMMTKELLAGGLSRIIIPTVYREDYLGALRTLSRHGDPRPLVRALIFAQRVTAACTAEAIKKAIDLWGSTYAFVEPGLNARLEMPNPAATVEWSNGVPAPSEYWIAEDDLGPGFRL